MDVEKLVRFCVEKLVDHPEAVVITQRKSPEKIVYEIRVDPTDRARIIGKQGRTFKALRTLVTLSTPENMHDIVLEPTT